MSKSSSSSNGGIGVTSLLTITFVVLKLCHVIDWKWIWVLSPIWIGIIIWIVVIVVMLIVLFVLKK